MASPALITLAALSPGLTFREALSGVLGSISLATWIFLLVRHVMLSLPAETTVGYNKQLTDGSQVPQLILNYKTGSADGISLAFLTVWLLGDATNLAGASYFPHQSLVACLSCLRKVWVCGIADPDGQVPRSLALPPRFPSATLPWQVTCTCHPSN
jgi:hypothetical protein